MQETRGGHSVVFFDLETTGLGPGCDIVQLAAVSGGHSINLYVLPRHPMQRGAARVTGFKVRRRALFLHRRRVLTNTLREVLVSFIAFLRMLGCPLVVGHNIRRFDCPLLTRALEQVGLRAEFDSSVSGCVDTLPLAREALRGRGVQSFRQENLVKELLGVDYQAHDALQDVRALQALYSALRPSPQTVRRHMFTLDTAGHKSVGTGAESSRQVTAQRPLCELFRQTLKLAGGGEEDKNKEIDGL